MKKNIVVVGLGRIGWLLENDKYRYHPCTHVGSILALKNRLNLVAGCDIDTERLTSFEQFIGQNQTKKSKGQLALFKSVDELCAAIGKELLPPVDVAVLATGPESHLDLFRKLLKSGVREFLIEKPISLDAKMAGQMLRLCQKYNAMVRVNFERRYHEKYRQIKTIIESNRFGALRYIEGRVLAPSLRRDALLEDAVHWIDLLLMYCGEPKSVTSSFRKDRRGLAKGSLHVFHYSDFDAVLESGGMRRYFEFAMRLDFERGRVIASNEGHLYFESRPSKRYQGFYDLQPLLISQKKATTSNPWLVMYREIADSSPIYQTNSSSLTEAVRGIKLIDRCRQSI